MLAKEARAFFAAGFLLRLTVCGAHAVTDQDDAGVANSPLLRVQRSL
jgi:hypothetical protein